MNLNPFRRLSQREILSRQLTEAELDLIEAEFAAEHYAAMIALTEARIDRLRERLSARGEDAAGSGAPGSARRHEINFVGLTSVVDDEVHSTVEQMRREK